MIAMRSWLFVPGNNARMLRKILELDADVFIIDLEDSISIEEKHKARTTSVNASSSLLGKNYYFRVNTLNSEWFIDDVKAAAGTKAKGIILPKAETRGDIDKVVRILDDVEAEYSLPSDSLELVPLIESALGVYNAFDIATTSKRIKRLVFGSVDFTLDINAKLTKEGTELLYARSHLVVASRAAGIESPIDAIFTGIHDGEGLQNDAGRARQLGFQGKLVIHPNQIEIVNRTYSPSKEEVSEAKAIVTAYEKALSNGIASIQMDGKMIDLPVFEQAKKIMKLIR